MIDLRNTHLSLFMTCIGVLGAGGANPARAQSAQAAPETDAIQEIVVTAQRREERLQDVGMTVLAQTGDSLISKGVTNIEDLARVVPGLTATDTPYGSPVLTMRGVGFYESALAGSSPVAAYIDEIPIPYTRMAAGAGLDIQRVEVAKGPQGTLYGQNSTGGAINYVTNKPTSTMRAGADVSFGRFSDVDAQGFVSGPVTDTLGMRLAVRTHQSNEWQQSVSRNDSLGAARFVNARLLIDFRPTSKLFFEVNANVFNDKSDTQAVQGIAFVPNNPAAVQPAELAAVLTPPGDNRLADWDAGSQFRRNNTDVQIALKVRYDVNDHMSVHSITASNRYRQDQFNDADGTNAEAAGATQDGYINSISQELRLQGDFDRIKYVIGGNFSRDNIFDDSLFYVGDGSQAHGIPGFNFRIGRTQSHQHADTYSAFTDVEYRLTDQFAINGGIRFTKQNRDFIGCLGDPGEIGGGAWARLFSLIYNTTIPLGGCTTIDPATGVIGPVQDKLDQSNVSWRAALNYKPNPDALFYLSVSRGFKAGSFSTVGGAVSTQYIPAKQESLVAYEIGNKLSLLSNRVELNAAVFYYDYSDKQFRGKILDPIFGSIEKLYNVPKSKVTGAELQIVARPIRQLTFDANVTYAKTKITSDFDSLNPVALPTNLQGQTFELTPEWAAGANLTYDFPLSGSKSGFASVYQSFQSNTHGGYGNDPTYKIDSYALTDLVVGVRDSGDHWRAQLWGRNVFDTYYWTNANYLGEFAYRYAGRPRTYGVSFSYRY